MPENEKPPAMPVDIYLHKITKTIDNRNSSVSVSLKETKKQGGTGNEKIRINR